MRAIGLAIGSVFVSLSIGAVIVTPRPEVAAAQAALFETADRCQACHNGLTTSSGADVSMGVNWRASMMAHSARDPYWHAGVRREMLDHPAAAREIEHECSRCHMPMAHLTQTASGATGQVFAHLPIGRTTSPLGTLAADGVSCTTCHQIRPDKLGTPDSFTGHFVIDTNRGTDRRLAFGPFQVDPGLQRVMMSATTFQPAEGAHVQSSELCATCHTLYTHTLDDTGRAIGRLPEQVPYLEWRHSSYRATMSCQACHMPVVQERVPISSTLGNPREGLSRHTFRGANFWMLKVLTRYRDDLGVPTLPQDLELAARDTVSHLQQEAAAIAIDRLVRRDDLVLLDVSVRNDAGHKLPTAYPSRRAWLHVRIEDPSGRIVFESGAPLATGAIAGNDNDADGAAFEPHHEEISRPDQVQIYEAVMLDAAGRVTTGLLSGLRYGKDNRLLPDGFDKSTADPDVAVLGSAAGDADFRGGGDRLRYRIAGAPAGTLTVVVELLYQSIGYRWAANLRGRGAIETDRFVGYYEAMSHVTTATLASATAALK
jgi:hypothetical protein